MSMADLAAMAVTDADLAAMILTAADLAAMTLTAADPDPAAPHDPPEGSQIFLTFENADRCGQSATKSKNWRQKAHGINPKCTIVKKLAKHSPRRELRPASYAKKELATWR
jgi:hypothetical protein